MMHEKLIQLITERVILSDEEREWCASYFEPVVYSKNTSIEAEGKIPQYLYFIVSGYVRLFHQNEKVKK